MSGSTRPRGTGRTPGPAAACARRWPARIAIAGVVVVGVAGTADAAHTMPMTAEEAVAVVLAYADPTASATPAVADAERMTLAQYEGLTYDGVHVNAGIDPNTQVWVVSVAAPPNPALADVPPGVTPPVHRSYVVVLDLASHHWIEEDFLP